MSTYFSQILLTGQLRFSHCVSQCVSKAEDFQKWRQIHVSLIRVAEARRPVHFLSAQGTQQGCTSQPREQRWLCGWTLAVDVTRSAVRLPRAILLAPPFPQVTLDARY